MPLLTEEKGVSAVHDRARDIVGEVKKAVVGKDETICKVLMVILAGGHILLEDIPGVGKTTLALAFSRAMDLDYRRVQFTPDVMPSDVVGYSVYNKGTGLLEYRPGAALCNLLLADEINRTSPKTQSALLEVMEEGAVTVDGVTRETPKPFVVIATQNPVGSAGTQLLPESQMDRFMACLSLGYPAPDDEVRILKLRRTEAPAETVGTVAGAGDLLLMREETEAVHISDELYTYLVRLSAATREEPMLRLGLSPRGTIALAKMSRASAYLAGRDYVIPGDVALVFGDVAGHRVVLSGQAKVAGLTAGAVLKDLFARVPAPRLTRRAP